MSFRSHEYEFETTITLPVSVTYRADARGEVDPIRVEHPSEMHPATRFGISPAALPRESQEDLRAACESDLAKQRAADALAIELGRRGL